MRLSESGPAKGISKEKARSGLDRLQGIIGLMLLASASAGAYLLATDRSLWLLAVSHAAGLLLIVAMDLVIGVLSLASWRKAYLPSIASAVLAVVLQLGDIATAPQYNMNVSYFADYLFGLWAFDVLLALQLSVILLGVAGRRYAQYLARRKTRRGRELSYSRRGFLKSILGFAGLIGLGVVVSSLKIPVQPKSTVTTTTTTTGTSAPVGAVANVNDLKVGSPVLFYFPAGYPNVLIKKADGTVSALSLLCTHVCCDMSQFISPDGTISCPCHGSVFDSNGTVLQGPAVVPLPTVEYTVNSQGYIVPTRVSNPGPCGV